MYNLDQKDRKILYELDADSRAPLSHISKKVKLSKSSVRYRINKLIENKIIKNFHTMINTALLGLTPVRIQLRYQHQSADIKTEIIDYFMKNECTSIIVSTQGFFDLSVIMQIKYLKIFIETWEEIQTNFGMYFEKQIITFPVRDIHFRPSFILQENYIKKDRQKPIIIDYYQNNNLKVDNTDIEILKLLSAHARLKFVEITNRVNLTDRAVKYRLNNLIKRGIIVGFRLNIDLSKIGYQAMRTYIYLNNYSDRFKIIEYVKYHPNLTWIDTTVGESHIELEFQLENIKKLHYIMEDLINKFPNLINKYKYVLLIKIHKYLYLPDKF